jgi:uncharacterized protein (DUF488 family)
VGHSTLSFAEFVALLLPHGIQELVDVRRYPGSRRYPHFGSEALEGSLDECGIRYRHMIDLGGRRRTAGADSPNTAWRSPSFRAYADYMSTPVFANALNELISIASLHACVIMCAEAVPWRCHRQLIADALVARGIPVRHIIGTQLSEHKLSPHAVVLGDGRIEYPADPTGDLFA